MAILSSAASTNIPNGTMWGYDCSVLTRYPLQGSEVLLFASLFLGLIVAWSIVYIDVVLKQMSPSKYLGKRVQTLIKEIQTSYPNITLTEGEKKNLYDSEEGEVPPHYATLEDGSKVRYDAVRSSEAYISGKTVDLDLVIALANNRPYNTMSGYSAATTRGYSMLATTLSATAFTTTFLCLHNFIVNNRAAEPGWLGLKWGTYPLFFYPFILCTSIVMTSVGNTVWRESNIMLWTEVPYTIKGKYNPIRHLHVGGVVMFGIAVVCHVVQALTWGPAGMPNYHTASGLMMCMLAGAATFGIGSAMGGKFLKCFTPQQGAVVSIAGEWFMMLSAFFAYVHWESYATMWCSGHHATFDKMLVGAFLAPFAYVASHEFWAPNDYTSKPSLMLTYKGQPVAVAGPCPAQAYRGEEYTSSPGSIEHQKIMMAATRPLPRVQEETAASEHYCSTA